MASLPACTLVVTAEIDTSVEDEWNKWYDEVHLPEALACPGVLAGRRYRTAKPASLTDHGAKSTAATRTYLALYELAGPEALDTPEFQQMRGWYQFAPHIKSQTYVYVAREA